MRIVKESTGVVDGISLRSLVPGVVYDLPRDFAEYLLTCKCAELVFGHKPATSAQTEDEDQGLAERATQGVKITHAEAADKPRRTRRRKKARR